MARMRDLRAHLFTIRIPWPRVQTVWLLKGFEGVIKMLTFATSLLGKQFLLISPLWSLNLTKHIRELQVHC